ncbi:hypothetical protein JCM6882_001010 [Rhodosporidiobolus microsporus]
MSSPDPQASGASRSKVGDDSLEPADTALVDSLKRLEVAESADGTQNEAGEQAVEAGGRDDSFSSTGSIIYHPDADTSGRDSSFDTVDFASSGAAGASAESSFEIVGSGADETAVQPSLRDKATPEEHDFHTAQATTPVTVTPADEHKHDDDDSHSGLLNPEAPTFQLVPSGPHTLIFPPGTTFDDIVLYGKNEIGDLTPDARAALHDLGLKLIPAMHGPLSLPYARCPSGIDAFLPSAAQEEEDPHPFVVDPTAPLARPPGAPLPLPGNSRFAHHPTRFAPRATSGPAALEASRMRGRNVSGGSTGKAAAQPTSTASAGSRRKPAPAFPNAPRTTVAPSMKPSEHSSDQTWLQNAQQAYQAQLAQQAHLAHQAHQVHLLRQAQLAPLQIPSAYPYASVSPFIDTSPYAATPGLPSPPSPLTSPRTPVIQPPHFLYPNAVQPYGVVSVQPGTAAALAAQLLQQPSIVAQSRRNSLLAAGLMQPSLAPAVKVDSLTLLQLAAEQQQREMEELGVYGGASAPSSRSVSYETAPDENADLDDDRLAYDPALNVDSSVNDAANEEGAFFYPSLGPKRPAADYLQRRRQSAAPSFPQPGGRRPSLAPAVDVGPRRASIAPQARLGKEEVPPSRPAHSRSAAGTHSVASSRRPSVVFHRQPSYPNLGVVHGAAGGKAKPRVFSEVGNTVGVNSSSRPAKAAFNPVRHASDSATNWRRRPAVVETPPTPAAEGKGKGKATPPAGADVVSPPSDGESWSVVERVAEELLSASTAGRDNAATSSAGGSTSGEPTPMPGSPTLGAQQTPHAPAAMGEKKPKRKGHGRFRGGRGRGRAPTGTANPAVVASSSSAA